MYIFRALYTTALQSDKKICVAGPGKKLHNKRVSIKQNVPHSLTEKIMFSCGSLRILGITNFEYRCSVSTPGFIKIKPNLVKEMPIVFKVLVSLAQEKNLSFRTSFLPFS